MNRIHQAVRDYANDLRSRIGDLQDCAQSAPEGQLCYRIKAGKSYFSVRRSTDGRRTDLYLPKAEMPRIKALACKKYASWVLPDLEKDLAAAESFLKAHSGSDEDDLAAGRDRIILSLCKDIYTTKSDFAEAWLAQKWEEQPFQDYSPQFQTLRGDIVRSKSEVFIANCLFRNDLIYLYEKPLYLPGFEYPYFPDFTVLDLYTRQESIWDHLGKMDDPGYVSRNMRKIRNYEKNGFVLGKNLFLTFETKALPFSAADAERAVKAFFLK